MRTYPRIVELFKADLDSGMSLRSIVRKTGLNSNTISNYLEGLTEPTQASFEKIAAAYGVTPAWLRGDTEQLMVAENRSDAVVMYGVSEAKRRVMERLNSLSDQQVRRLQALLDILETDDDKC